MKSLVAPNRFLIPFFRYEMPRDQFFGYGCVILSGVAQFANLVLGYLEFKEAS
jgi:hypothetical protein